MAGGFYQQNRSTGLPGGLGDTGDAAPAGGAKPAEATSEAAGVSVTTTGMPNASSFEKGGSGAGGNPLMTLPKQFASLANNNPKIASAVTAFNALPPTGQATISNIANFVAQNPGQTANVVGNLQDVLDGKIVIPNLAFSNAEVSGNSTAPGSVSSGQVGTGGIVGETSGNLQQVGKSVVSEASGNLGVSVQPESFGADTTSMSSMGILGGGTGIPAGADIEELAFVVLMQATNDQDNDLQEIMNEVQAQTKAKQFLRQQMQVVNTDVANNASQQTTDANGAPIVPPPAFPAAINQNFYSNFQMPNAGDNGVSYYNVDLTSNQPLTTVTQLKAIQTDLQGDLDSMNEMSEMTSMRLQMAMDRRSKFVETLSNVLKKIDETSDAIVQNMK